MHSSSLITANNTTDEPSRPIIDGTNGCTSRPLAVKKNRKLSDKFIVVILHVFVCNHIGPLIYGI